jgi:hypothetical protein
MEECRAKIETVADRCYGGSSSPAAEYIGDLKCWPFSESRRLTGRWVIEMEGSTFYPDAKPAGEAENRRSGVHLQTDLIERRPEMLAAAQGSADTLVYAVELKGREALCDGYFGHGGIYPRQVIVEQFYSIKLVNSPGP